MKNLPGVSIYIVTYLNSEERGAILKDTCEWALKQNYPIFEVVVSDNAGRFLATEVLKTIHDPRLKVFRNEKNIGMAPNMNLCLERCVNEIIKVSCDDDLLHPDTLRLSVPYVDDETLVVVGLEKFIIGSVPAEIHVPVGGIPRKSIRSSGCGRTNNLWKFSYDGLPGCTLFTKKYFASLGRYDTRSKVEDWDFLIMSRLMRSVCFVDQTLCYQGVWPESLTESMLANEPYFFPQAGLYTKFKVLANDSLCVTERFHLKRMLIVELLCESLRALRHTHRREYRIGYVEYLKSFFRKGM